MSKNENSKKEKKDLLNEIYQQSFVNNSVTRKTVSYIFIFCLIISLISGFLAGFLQNTWYQDYYSQQIVNQQPTTAVNKNQTKQVLDLNFLLKQDNNNYTQVLSQLRNQLVGFYKKHTGTDALSSLYLEKDFLGTGFVVTSDGWVLTQQDIVKDNNFVIVTSDRKVYQSLSKVVDPFSQTALIKIAAEGLTPVKFSDLDTVKPTDYLLVAKYSLQNHGSDIVKTTIKKFAYHDQNKGKDFLLSTEAIDHYLEISDNLNSFYNGAILVNDQVEVAGVLLPSNQSGVSLAIPSYYLNTVINNFLASSGEVMRSYFGVHYLDLSETLGLDPKLTLGLTKGALLFTDALDKLPAVTPKSPAADIGLKDGDIILKVNNDDVDEKNSLTKLINEYTPGQELNLSVRRDDNTLQLKAVLSELPK